MKADQKAWRDLREGAYLLRTNLQADSAEEMWSKYMQLTEAEASFRALKSELSGGGAGSEPRDGGLRLWNYIYRSRHTRRSLATVVARSLARQLSSGSAGDQSQSDDGAEVRMTAVVSAIRAEIEPVLRGNW
jgi:hypothetical protein